MSGQRGIGLPAYLPACLAVAAIPGDCHNSGYYRNRLYKCVYAPASEPRHSPRCLKRVWTRLKAEETLSLLCIISVLYYQHRYRRPSMLYQNYVNRIHGKNYGVKCTSEKELCSAPYFSNGFLWLFFNTVNQCVSQEIFTHFYCEKITINDRLFFVCLKINN